jgi:hypothetical protein
LYPFQAGHPDDELAPVPKAAYRAKVHVDVIVEAIFVRFLQVLLQRPVDAVRCPHIKPVR